MLLVLIPFFSTQISIFQRLVFDFLGYMWLLVLFGIAALIFVIFGLFGAHQQKTRLIVTVSPVVLDLLHYDFYCYTELLKYYIHP